MSYLHEREVADFRNRIQAEQLQRQMLERQLQRKIPQSGYEARLRTCLAYAELRAVVWQYVELKVMRVIHGVLVVLRKLRIV